MRPCDLVDPLIGTDNTIDFSSGNVLPLTALPWGTHHWCPVNAPDRSWFFRYRDHTFQGLRLTHQPSPWMGDWCHATLMPQSGERRTQTDARAQDVASRDLDLKPHRCAGRLPTQAISWEAAPTMHGLVMRCRFTADGPRRILIDSAETAGHRGDHLTSLRIDPGRGEIVLTTASGAGLHQAFRLHLVLRCDLSGVDGGLFDLAGDRPGVFAGDGAALGGWLELPPGSGVVTLRLAASFVDEASARRLLDAEVVGRDVEAVAAAAASAWDDLLGRIELSGETPAREALVRTMQYRTYLFPRRIDEAGPDGAVRHRCPDTGVVRDGVRVTDNGFWDTARTVYPWYALTVPDHLPTILEGWIAGARSTGWHASWASPGHRACMTGSYADAVFADAWSRGIRDWDLAGALHHLRRHVEEPVEDRCPYGRIGLDAYLAHGFVPHERCSKATARTLDYAYGDWCLAGLAEAAGDKALAGSCRSRADAWKHVLDPASGFFRGRHADGSWLEPFDPLSWGGPYVEGSAWQFAWHVPHQPAELITARGGPTKALAFLERLLTEPPTYRFGTYGRVIHEMREMAAVDFGQYAHSNQPSHFTLPYLSHCGAPARFSAVVHRVLGELHRPTPDGLPGDEDNGELAAWWLCAALGLFPDCPGSGKWLRLRPWLREWRLQIPGRKPLSVRTRGGDHEDAWTADDGAKASRHLDHATLAAGGSWMVGAAR